MTKKNDKALEKIKKLLRLAKSNNPHEAALALSRAQKMMQEHGIDGDAPELAGVCDSIVDALSKAKSPTRYLVQLVHIISKALGCDFYFQPTFKAMQVVFIGHDERPVIAGYVFTVLERQLTKARKEFIDSLCNRMKKANKTKRADHFCEGWCFGVWQKVEALAVTDAEKEQMLTYKNNIDLSDGKARGAKGSGSQADSSRHQGYIAAKDVTLNHGVNGEEMKKLAS